MSRSALSLNPVRTFSALTKPLALPEQALVVATDHEIPSLFASKIPSTENISFFLQAVLLQNLEAGGLTSVSVKDFLAMRCSKSKSAIVPYLQLTEMTQKPIENGGGNEKNYIIDINKNIVANESSNLLIEKNIAEVVNLFYSDKVKNKLPVPLDNGAVIEFRIVNNSRSVKIDEYKIEAKLKLSLSFVEAQGLDTPYILNCNSKEVLDARDILEGMLSDALIDGYELSKTCGIDFLGIENLLYQKYGTNLDEKWREMVTFDATFDIEVTENS
jgi:hypothetical protein